MRSVILIVFFVISGIVAGYAQKPSTFVSVNEKMYTVHQVKTGETFYSISKRYGIVLDSLKMVNRLDSAATIKPGDLLIVPLSATNMPGIGVVVTATPDNCIVHVAKSGESLYSIARQYPHTSVKEIKTINKLTSDTVNIGQQLFIPKPNGSGMVEPTKPGDTPTGAGVMADAADSIATYDVGVVQAQADSTDEERMVMTAGYDVQMLGELHELFKKKDSSKSELVVVKSAALWMHDSNNYNQTKFFALHKTAPIGSVLQVRNLMNNRVVYVKVIGKLPENAETYNVQIQVSAAAARFMNVLDDKFLVEITSHQGEI